MLILLGKTGYIGRAFDAELRDREMSFLALSRVDRDYTRFDEMRALLEEVQCEAIINCGAYIPHESVALCDSHMAETIQGNTLFPAMLAKVCELYDVTLCHISTACLWSDGKEHSEDDPIQRAFTGHCGNYIGTKVIAEQEVRKHYAHFICRVRLPFDEFDNDRNYLSKLTTLPVLWDQWNSASHRGDFVKACLDLLEMDSPFGTYNICNPGVMNSVRTLEEMRKRGLTKHVPKEILEKKDGECQVNVDKLLAAGVKIRSVQEAIEESLTKWTKRL